MKKEFSKSNDIKNPNVYSPTLGAILMDTLIRVAAGYVLNAIIRSKDKK